MDDGEGKRPRGRGRWGAPLRLRMRRNLRLGQTPFDDLDKESLIRLACAQHVALGRAHSALVTARQHSAEIHGGRLGPFWVGPHGYARWAMFHVERMLELVTGRNRRHEAEQHEAVFRYVDELLLPTDPADEREVFPTMTCRRCAVWCRHLSGDASRPFQGNLRLCGPGGRDCPEHRPLSWAILRAGETEPETERERDGHAV